MQYLPYYLFLNFWIISTYISKKHFLSENDLICDFHHNKCFQNSFKLETANHPGKKQMNKKWEEIRRKIIKIQQLFTPFILHLPFLLRFPSTRRKIILVKRAFPMTLRNLILLLYNSQNQSHISSIKILLKLQSLLE